MTKYEDTNQLINELSDYNPKFKDGFSDRVIDSIEELGDHQKYSLSEFTNLFRWIALSGVAAIIVLLISIYTIDGSINLDAVFGIFNFSPDNPELTMLDY